MAGGCAGSLTLTLVYPLDLARTRISTDIGKNHREFTSLRDCMNKI